MRGERDTAGHTSATRQPRPGLSRSTATLETCTSNPIARSSPPTLRPSAISTSLISAPPQPQAAGAVRPPVDVALVLDRSGSMDGNKLAMAREAVTHAIRLLKPDDHLGVVCYDDQVTTVLDRTPATPEAKALATRRLKSIDARGSTDLHGGWLRGAELARAQEAGGARAVEGAAADRRPGQSRRDRSRRDDRDGVAAAPGRHHHLHVWRRRRLRRGTAVAHRHRGWRPLLLHREGHADSRPVRQRAGRDAGSRGARRRVRGVVRPRRRGDDPQRAAVGAGRRPAAREVRRPGGRPGVDADRGGRLQGRASRRRQPRRAVPRVGSRSRARSRSRSRWRGGRCRPWKTRRSR